MIIKSLELVNFCQHENLKLDLPGAGVTVITGKNGVGKSNMIRAIEFALTGKFLETSRNKQDFITYGKDTGGVSIAFEHNGSQYEVTRTLHGNGATLRGPNNTLSGITAVNSFMDNLLGANSAIVNEFVVVKQGRLNSLLEATNSNRLGLFMKLFNLDRIDALHRRITSEIATYSSFTLPPIPSDELETSLKSYIKQKEIVLSQIKSLDYDPDLHEATDKKVREIEHDLKRAETRKEQIEKLTAASLRYKVLEDKLKELKTKRELLQKDFDEFSKECPESLFNDIQVYKNLDFENKIDLLAQLEEDLQKINEVSHTEPEPIEPVEEELTKVSNKVSTLSESVELYKGYVDKFKSGECPTCGTAKVISQTQIGKSIQEYAVEAEQEVERLQAKLEEATKTELSLVLKKKQLKEEHAKYQSEKSRTEKLKTEIESRIKAISSELLRFSHLLDFNLEEAEQKADKFRMLEVDLAKSINAVDTVNSDLENCSTLINALSDGVKSEKIPDKDTLNKELAEYTALLEDFKEAKNKHNELVLEGRVLDDKRVNLEKSLEATIEMEKNCAKQKQYVALLNDAKAIFHRSAYPTVASAQYLHSLNVHWNDILSNLSVPFSVNVVEDLSIYLQGADNNINVDAASGGQKACLSIAFLLAVNKLFTSNIGFMLLDEPTYGLDEDHIIKLVDLLLYDINKFASNSNIQIFVVTHEDKFKDSFDKKIVLQ